ncbi:MAG: hypothetical protein HQK76_02395 [Desulfobacterales bacterium]|nr:hypothetical protein [Desulfobacterales bacterium]
MDVKYLKIWYKAIVVLTCLWAGIIFLSSLWITFNSLFVWKDIIKSSITSPSTLLMFVPSGFMFLTLWLFTGISVILAYFIYKKQKFVLCRVLGGILCLFFPYGSIVGIAVSIFLSIDKTKELFISAING